LGDVRSCAFGTAGREVEAVGEAGIEELLRELQMGWSRGGGWHHGGSGFLREAANDGGQHDGDHRKQAAGGGHDGEGVRGDGASARRAR
jgi:hypothetical protein